MRLTLRTMLAYLDDILEPDDTETIGKKIEDSEFASTLVHRTRDCLRRLRLGVPPLFGRGLAADPNTVAEYLDNTLDADRVQEFETICLESDVHLAEVAACHQVLTLVIDRAAEVPSELRQRVYQSVSQVEAPPVQTDGVRPNSMTPPPVDSARRRAKPEVPDYLREPRSRLWPVAAVVLVTALVTFAGLLFFGPAGLRQRLTAFLESPADETVPAEDAAAEKPAEDATPPALSSRPMRKTSHSRPPLCRPPLCPQPTTPRRSSQEPNPPNRPPRRQARRRPTRPTTRLRPLLKFPTHRPAAPTARRRSLTSARWRCLPAFPDRRSLVRSQRRAAESAARR